MRYQLLPSLIAGGAEATASGFPIAARADLFWPSHTEAASNDAYLWLNDTLVAPIFDSSHNETSRTVWIPPGDWHDFWTGAIVSGPKTVTATQPYERQPMWHRAGGFVVLADRGATRVDEQDWSSLTLDCFPATTAATTSRTLVEKHTADKTSLRFSTDGTGRAIFAIGASPTSRAWTVRVHLRPGQQLTSIATESGSHEVTYHAPLNTSMAAAFRPFGGRDSAPAPHAGPVAEIALPAASHARSVEVVIA